MQVNKNVGLVPLKELSPSTARGRESEPPHCLITPISMITLAIHDVLDILDILDLLDLPGS